MPNHTSRIDRDRHEAEQRRQAAEAERHSAEQTRRLAEDARGAAERDRAIAEDNREAAMKAVRATSDALAETLEHMEAVEAMRRLRAHDPPLKPN